MPVARVWKDSRDGKSWIVEKRGGLVVRTADYGGTVPEIETPRLRFSSREVTYEVDLPMDAPLTSFTDGHLQAFFDRAKGRGPMRH